MAVLLKKLSISELRKIYYFHVMRDFPLSERKPMWIISRYYRKGIYAGYGLYDATGVLCAYAMVLQPDGGSVLVDYLAAVRGGRSKGHGSAIVQALREVYGQQGIIIEVENPAYAKTIKRKEEMQRRILFYARLGFVKTDIKARVFSAQYNIMALREGGCDSAFARESIGRHYDAMFPPLVRRLVVRFHGE